MPLYRATYCSPDHPALTIQYDSTQVMQIMQTRGVSGLKGTPHEYGDLICPTYLQRRSYLVVVMMKSAESTPPGQTETEKI